MKFLINFQKKVPKSKFQILVLLAHHFSVSNEDAINFFRFIGEGTDFKFFTIYAKTLCSIVSIFLTHRLKSFKKKMCVSVLNFFL